MKRTIFYCVLLLIKTNLFAQIGIATATPASSLEVAGSFSVAPLIVSGNTTLTSSDYNIKFTGSSASAISLPDAVNCSGRIYLIKNASTTSPTPVLTIATSSSQTIEGISSWLLDEHNEAVRLISNGANWEVYVQNVPVKKSTTIGARWNEGGNRLKYTRAIGAISNHDFPFKVNNTEVARISTNNYLGIGTNSPLGKLHIVNDNSGNGNDFIFDDYQSGTAITGGILIRKAYGTTASAQNMDSGNVIGQFRFIPRYNSIFNNDSSAGIDAYYMGSGTTGKSDLRFFTSNNEQMRINEGGRVGLGSPILDSLGPEKLLVEVGETSSYNVISGKGEIDNYLQMNIKNTSSGALASTDIVATADNGDESLNYIDLGINSSGSNNPAYPILSGVHKVYLYSTGADFIMGNGTSGKNLLFFTNGYALANERLRISSSGDVGIGTSTVNGKLTVAGIVTPSPDNTYSIGTSASRWSDVWSANGTIQTSDIRLKTNIQPLNYGLKEISQLNPIAYNWIKEPDKNKKIGLLAQSVQQVVPEVVIGNADTEKLGMNYAELVAVLINSIKEEYKHLEELEKELVRLKTKN
jgi:Chaperone of endosialidase